ncbi:MAG: NADP-dependent oxidoreductase [Deltaproteobacteria bacterium]|nr:MAG: NADP-dependent oxidoreductase [Deltaproteobacteria bacterium]
MKAARIHAYGGPEVLRVEDAPEPVPGPKQVLVEVHATSVNPIDTKIRGGYLRAGLRYKLPRILGLDVSGVVRAVGAKVTGFRPGDAVWSSPGPKLEGTYAELVCVPEAELALKPTNLTHQEAAALPLVALTAWQALFDRGRLKAGDRVLVQAGSGGVGTVAIQLAKHAGAWVATTCSARNAELVTGLGADRVVDYTQEDYTQVLSDLDVVLDALGPAEMLRGRKIVKKGGHLVGITPDVPGHVQRSGPVLGLAATGLTITRHRLGGRWCAGIHASFVTRRPDGAQLAQLTEICEAGALRPVIDRVLPLDDIVEAHRYSETGRARGKIVIAVR